MTTRNNGKETRRILWLFFAGLGSLLLSIGFAIAAPVGPSYVGNISSGKGNISFAPRVVQAEAGNVSEINLSANSITKAWQGYYGNISGQILLQDALGNNFYTWNNSLVTGNVFASRNSAVNWANINCTNSTGLVKENVYVGKNETAADSVNNTFSVTNHPAITVAGVTLTNCWSTQPYGPSGGPSGANFWNVLLTENNSAGLTIYATMINRSTLGVRNMPTDFELLVGENGNSSSLAPTPYFFYVELS